jgi:hypothetical protein
MAVFIPPAILEKEQRVLDLPMATDRSQQLLGAPNQPRSATKRYAEQRWPTLPYLERRPSTASAYIREAEPSGSSSSEKQKLHASVNSQIVSSGCRATFRIGGRCAAYSGSDDRGVCGG